MPHGGTCPEVTHVQHLAALVFIRCPSHKFCPSPLLISFIALRAHVCQGWGSGMLSDPPISWCSGWSHCHRCAPAEFWECAMSPDLGTLADSGHLVPTPSLKPILAAPGPQGSFSPQGSLNLPWRADPTPRPPYSSVFVHLAPLMQARPSRRWSCKYLPCWFQERHPNPFTWTLDRSASVSVYSPTLPPKLFPPNREPLHPTPYPIRPLLRKFPKPRRATFTFPSGSEALLQWKQWTQIWNANQTTKSYHLTQVRMAIIKKSANNKCWRGYREKRPFLHCWWECKLIQLLWRTVLRFLLKTINRTTTWPSNPTLGNIPWDNNNWKKHMYLNIHWSTIYNGQDKKAT